MKSVHSQRYKALLGALVEARKSAGVTQAQLAGNLGRPQSFVSKYEVGERRLDIEEFLEICDLLGADAVRIVRQVRLR